jgi:hypothetical protein
LGQLCFSLRGGQPRYGEEAHGRNRGEQLPDETPDKAGISEDLLFFQEAEKSLEGVCHGVFLYQLWLRLITFHTLWITSEKGNSR